MFFLLKINQVLKIQSLLPDLEFISGAGRRALSVVLCVFASFLCLDLAETGRSYIVHLCDKIEVTEDMALGQ